jgi:hypothetical protein
MVNAARPRPPAWWPVVAWTFFFGPLGVVAASRRAGQARRGRNSVAPYWVAWSVTLAVSAVAGMVVFAAGVPAYLAYREGVVTEVVQANIVGDAKLRSASGAVTSAVCEPIGPRDRDGIRLYECVLTMENGRTGSLTVTADADGNWTAAKK